MSATKRVEGMMPKHDKSWSTYSSEGDHGVNMAMQYAVGGILGIMKEEDGFRDAGELVRKSIAERLIVVEDAVKRFRMAERTYPKEGLGDSDVRDRVIGFLNRLLMNSGVGESLTKQFTDTLDL